MRMYQKFDSGYSVPTSNHNGIRLSAKYPETAGIIPPADGTGFFLFLLQNNMIKARWKTHFRASRICMFIGRSQKIAMGRPLVSGRHGRALQ